MHPMTIATIADVDAILADLKWHKDNVCRVAGEFATAVDNDESLDLDGDDSRVIAKSLGLVAAMVSTPGLVTVNFENE
jgi:hypothetical protein